MRILLVDDDEVDRLSILRELDRAGLDAEVEVALDGEQALERLRGGPCPDVVLLDMNMPRCGGLELLAALRAEDELCRTAVIVLSTSDDPQDMRAAYDLEAAGYIVKGGRGGAELARLVESCRDSAERAGD